MVHTFLFHLLLQTIPLNSIIINQLSRQKGDYFYTVQRYIILILYNILCLVLFTGLLWCYTNMQISWRSVYSYSLLTMLPKTPRNKRNYVMFNVAFYHAYFVFYVLVYCYKPSNKKTHYVQCLFLSHMLSFRFCSTLLLLFTTASKQNRLVCSTIYCNSHTCQQPLHYFSNNNHSKYKNNKKPQTNPKMLNGS